MPSSEPKRRRKALRAASAACVVGLLYAGISVYWGLGGSWLLDTVGGALAQQGRDRTAGAIFAVWAAAALKAIAAVLPLLALRPFGSAARHRQLRLLGWIAAVVLTVYGLVLTVVGLLVQSGAIQTSGNADHRALAWHAYLWDPWFLVWGLLIAAALYWGTARRGSSAVLERG